MSVVLHELAHGIVAFLGGFAWLQMLGCLFNLVPIPGLDGFGIIEPFMDDHSRAALTPQLRRVLFVAWFLIIWHVPGVFQAFHHAIAIILRELRFDIFTIDFFGRA